MSEQKSITINFFDINGEYNENVPVNTEKIFLLLDCPIRIIDQYINDNFIQDVKKYTKDQFILQYQFGYEIKKNVNIIINCDIINNFSVSHSGSLESDGYIVFCNLENKDTLELLEKIVDYIKENCSLNIKTYVIGVFEENIDEDKTFNKMQSFLSELDFEFEYYEMFLGKKDMFKIISKEYDNALIMEDAFKEIFKEIYEGGKGPRFYKKDNNYKDGADRSMVGCLLF